MEKGVIIGIGIAAAVIVILGAWWWYTSSQAPAIYTVNQNENNNNQSVDSGTVYLSVTDAAVNMGSVSKVTMTVDKSYVHSQAQGWVQVSSNSQTFSLLELKSKNQAQLLGRADLAADTYDQIWFHVTAVKITESGKEKTATLPSNDVKISAIIKVMPNANTVATIDVLADQSLYKTDKGEFVFAPSIKLETRNSADVTVDGSNMVTVAGGTVDSNIEAGMDVNGEVKVNFHLDLSTTLKMAEGVITIK